jgi:hypothetical protein
VSPSGKVTWVAYTGGHNEIAYKIIDEKGWRDEFRQWECEGMNYRRYANDFLQEVKKYIRFQDWGAHPGWVKNNTPPTKRQEQRMFEIDNEIK